MKTMFVAVDYQYDFVCGALGFPGAELLDDSIVRCGLDKLSLYQLLTLGTQIPVLWFSTGM